MLQKVDGGETRSPFRELGTIAFIYYLVKVIRFIHRATDTGASKTADPTGKSDRYANKPAARSGVR
jgi:hypothetical protein